MADTGVDSETGEEFGENFQGNPTVDTGVGSLPTGNSENSQVGEYKIEKDESLIPKITNATEAYRVTKGNDEYVVFKGTASVRMVGGRSKSQKRGGKKQRQTKRKMGGRRRSNRKH